MSAVSNASPLIALARVGHLHFLPALFDRVHISTEVYQEVVISGHGLPGSFVVSLADWIQVTLVQDTASVVHEMSARGLGAGETSAVILARELGAGVVLMDERKGRRYAQSIGLMVLGTVGILEALYRRKMIDDLPGVYRELLRQRIRVDPGTLNDSLSRFALPLL